ncbi:HNH endonuclease signature motif containing protein, partial [Haloactinopolyspora alba]
AGREDAGRGGGRDMRTSAQRRADALVELARRQLDSGELPTAGGEAPHLNVTCDLDTLQARTGGHGELPDGTILRGEAVRRLACDADITRIITGPDSQPLDVGRTRRTATPAQRKALRIRDRGCRFPGCDRPAAWTQAHHVTFWSNGGSTDIDEMVLLCRHHHTTVHEGGWHIHTIGPGRFVFTNPAGQPVFAARAESTRHLVTRLVHLTTQPRAGPNHRAA